MAFLKNGATVEANAKPEEVRAVEVVGDASFEVVHVSFLRGCHFVVCTISFRMSGLAIVHSAKEMGNASKPILWRI